MLKPTIVYTGPADAWHVAVEAAGPAFTVRRVEPEAAEVAAALADAVALLDASMRVRVTAAMIRAAERLKVVVTATTGADHIDADALARRDIPLLTLRGQTEVLRQLTPAAEHSWLLAMACARRLRGALTHVVDEGAWDRTRFPGMMLRGRTIGVIGCGRIGQHIGTYARAFGMTAVGFDPYVSPWPEHIEGVSLRDLLVRADVVTVHVPYLPETRRLIGAAEIALLKRGAIIVNTSRGEIVDEGALVEGVTSGHLGGVAVDVLEGEPQIANHPLRRLAKIHPNVIITPHIGGFSPEAVQIVVRFSAQRIVSFLQAQ